MTRPQPKVFGLREVLYLGVVVAGLALIVQREFAVVLVIIYITLLGMALIAELAGR